MVSPGDRVKFLNDTGGGIVKEFRDSKIAIVLIDDGFEVPVLISELIYAGDAKGRLSADQPRGRDEKPESGQQTVKLSDISGGGSVDDSILRGVIYENNKLVDSGARSPGRADRNILIGLLEGEAGKNLEAWLINDSRFSVFYTVLKKEESACLNLMTGHIEPDTKIRIGRFSREEVNRFPEIRVQALFYMKGLYHPVSPAQADLEIDPVSIWSEGALTTNDFFDEPALIIHLISDSRDRETQKIREQEVGRLSYKREDSHPPADSFRGKPGVKKDDPLVEEVDLHIEELVEDHKGLSGREVLDLQMARFTTALEGALRGKTKRVVFIHGIGNGKLKFEIRKALDNKYSRLQYQDASFQEYGYGATLVIIRK